MKTQCSQKKNDTYGAQNCAILRIASVLLFIHGGYSINFHLQMGKQRHRVVLLCVPSLPLWVEEWK